MDCFSQHLHIVKVTIVENLVEMTISLCENGEGNYVQSLSLPQYSRWIPACFSHLE